MPSKKRTYGSVIVFGGIVKLFKNWADFGNFHLIWKQIDALSEGNFTIYHFTINFALIIPFLETGLK